MNIEEINAMWSVDSPIDDTNLSQSTSRIPLLHNKYFNILMMEGLRLKKMRSDYKEVLKAKHEYYNGTLDMEEMKERGWKPFSLKVLRNDIQMYLDADKDLRKLNLKIALQEETVRYLEEIIKQLNTRNFLIKNMIEWNRFTSGG